MRTKLLVMGCLVLALGGIGKEGGAEMRVDELRCEYKINPLGIDVTEPRLSWIVTSPESGQRQTAYQILVADSEGALARNEGNLWDSGKVESNETCQIAYKGSALGSRMQCYWKVQAWDATGKSSGWSTPAHWSMGLLKPEDWAAKWIGYDAPAPEQAPPAKAPAGTLEGSAWIWAAGREAADAMPTGECYLRMSFKLPAGPFASATLLISADNSCEVFVNGNNASAALGAINAFTRVYELDVEDFLKPVVNVLAIKAKNEGDAPNPAGVIAKLIVVPVGQAPIEVVTDASWEASVTKQTSDAWKADVGGEGWGAARVVAKLGEGPWQAPKSDPGLQLPPPPYLRKEFQAQRHIRRATLYATALGLYEVYLNGDRVGNKYFTPGWTDFNKRVYYNTYDVTDLVDAGEENAIGAILADGWYAGYLGFRLLVGMDPPRNFYGGEPRLCLQLELEYEDGAVERVVTDESWKAAYGPILEADLLMGETQDRQRERKGWDDVGFDDSAWQPVVAAESIRPLVQAHPGNAVEQFEEFPAQSMNEVQPGVYVYDLGQNMVGWARLKVKGEAGQRVQVRHAEMLQSDGSLYTVSLRKARAIDSYILSGHGAETLEPKFTFHGFRYVELTGLDKPPTPKDVVGVVLYSPLPQTGFFECSEPLLNQLYHNILWGQRGNYLEAPTDCPQRDERCGWTGDAQFFMPTSALVSDVSAFFTKWLVDLVQDAQLEDGSWADVAPNIGLGGGNVAWGDAAIICTYQMYRYYGDKRVLAQHYDYLMKGMQFLENSSENYLRKKLGYGDWLNLGGNAKDEVICTAYFAYLAGLMREMAEIIGRTPEAEHYAALEKNIKDAFVKNFIREDGSILDSSQTGYALAFTMDLIPDELKAKAAEHFQKEIERFDNHLATGFIGTPRLLPALSLAGKQDVAYQLLMNKTFPSWLFQVTLGATTMWERWDGWTPDKGFQDPGMNSFNHYAFGAVGEYLFTTVGGIQATAPGFSKIRIAPVPGGGLTWAKTRYDSIHGAIRSEWRIENGKFLLEVEIPANMEAVVELPSGLTDVAASDTVLAKPLEGAARGTAFTIQSGVCRFEARIS